MSKPLTLRNREDKGEVDRGLEAHVAVCLKAGFPSYFDSFSQFFPFLALRTREWSRKLRFRQEHEITSTAAIMAIV